VSVRVVALLPNAFLTDPVEVIAQFEVLESNQPHIVVVPPS
jgi:hypothetical protein